ncbi:katanin p80 WD40 repeat-containing subunit B1 homolog [Vigna radiata var. radiata]|uniref:Katanin p80 WD40 repeat-containing subunit B1 homolog n=1 Tax=Vigna radiata var. radiata TaxID=3916 RepID=A0A3Q0EZW5_VIGRR|nr:katanin p80 WD40 repeat-containing subunit B1 homolog [Vigna radiata var. radiata]XP_022636736.1 katanin p80 WD40 repeat-containing subunit B1 homolog [Vigna radiata var. radiata]XP_022636741.1 katanin p80 WD40 repeat-containing subunit B1 homolog [Vigna radiata var. radiata]
MTTKRAYKLQEFVAHASSVNCLKIGRKSSRVLVTGGEDHKVNLWAIGKPNAILSLSGHSSGIDSVSFDSSEVLVAAGAASGTIKLWDLEEAKIVRTLTGHRSNCTSVDFHPFGEFFASGSLDTNLKIWDIRKKGCIHTYKGHTRGVNAIRFTPDGRWVVSGGEDNTVKLWDLTAGKLLHDFKCHEGQIQCIDFHPNEFLLATGSADRTVKFWDLETFELIGSAGPETSGVRSLTFSPDGRTLLCGLHESLKVFSWEPIRCHDMVDVGWSKLSDLNVHEGKLLGCSYNQSCVGVWVVDISRIEPYALNSVNHLNGHSETKSSGGNMTVLNEISAKARLSVSQNPDQLLKETRSLGRLSVSSQDSDPLKEGKCLPSSGSAPSTPQRINLNSGPKTVPGGSTTVVNTTAQKRSSLKSHTTSNVPIVNKSDIIPVIVPRASARSSEPAADSRKEVGVAGRTMPFPLQSKAADMRKFSNNRDDVDKPLPSPLTESAASKSSELTGFADKNNFPASVSSTQDEARSLKVNRDVCSVEVQKGGRMRSLLNLEKRERPLNYEGPRQGISHGRISSVHALPFSGRAHSTEKATVSATDEDSIADVMEQHDEFLSSMMARSAKLQMVFRCWERNDVNEVIGIMTKMDDHAVIADVVSIIMEKIDIITLDICTGLLPLLTDLLQSEMERHQGISLEMLLKLVRIFGSVIYSTVSGPLPVGVDIEAEKRLERCNLCFPELEKVKRFLPSLSRRGGSIAKSAHELNLALQDVS